MQMSGKIVKLPIVKDKIIFTAIQEGKDKPIQAVLFRTARPAKLSTMLSLLKVDDEVTITGRLESNPMNKEMQIVIDDIQSNIKQEETPCPDYF